jgi:hypothetical protein
MEIVPLPERVWIVALAKDTVLRVPLTATELEVEILPLLLKVSVPAEIVVLPV